MVSVEASGAVCKGGVGLGSCYCFTGRGISSQRNMDLFQEMAFATAAWQGPWILVRGTSILPRKNSAAQGGWMWCAAWCMPRRLATRLSRTIDFFVVSKDFSRAVNGAEVVGDTGCTPHSAVRLLLSTRARQGTVRELRSILKFHAVQPHGPMNERFYDPTAESADELAARREAKPSAWSRYTTFLSSIEDHICELNTLTDEEMANHARRRGQTTPRRP